MTGRRKKPPARGPAADTSGDLIDDLAREFMAKHPHPMKVFIPVSTAALALWIFVPALMATISALLDRNADATLREKAVAVAVTGVLTALLMLASVWSGAVVRGARRRRWYGVSVLVICIPGVLVSAVNAFSSPHQPTWWIAAALYLIVLVSSAAWALRRI